MDWYDPRSAFTRGFEQCLMCALINSTLEDVGHNDAITPEQLEGILDRLVPSRIDWTALASQPVLGLDEIALTKGHTSFVVIVSAKVVDYSLILPDGFRHAGMRTRMAHALGLQLAAYSPGRMT